MTKTGMSRAKLVALVGKLSRISDQLSLIAVELSQLALESKQAEIADGRTKSSKGTSSMTTNKGAKKKPVRNAAAKVSKKAQFRGMLEEAGLTRKRKS